MWSWCSRSQLARSGSRLHKQSSSASAPAFPDLRAGVDRWCADGDLLFIEFLLYARVGSKDIEWPNVNRLVLRDGKAIERVTYFDPLAILPTLLRHPPIWWRWWRAR